MKDTIIFCLFLGFVIALYKFDLERFYHYLKTKFQKSNERIRKERNENDD